jgi:hypothetical protein
MVVLWGGPSVAAVAVTGYGENPRYSRYRVQILRYWVQTTVAGAKIPGAKLASTTIKDGALSLNLVILTLSLSAP